MITDSSLPIAAQALQTPAGRRSFPTLCWRAIFGGTVAAISIHILLTALGMGGGLAAFTPVTDANPIANFGIGAAIVWTVCALVALWFGGFVAGRFSHSLHSGFVHGILVWSLTLIITLLLLSMGTGMVLGGALNVIGGGLGIGAKAAAPAIGELSKDAASRTSAQLGNFTDEAIQSAPATATPKSTTRAKREIGFAVGKLFAPGNDISSQDNRAAAIKSLVQYSEMSDADATRTVDEWIASYKNLQAELERMKVAADQKARELADRAASSVSTAALWSFFALLGGLLASSLGGSCGAKRALLHADVLHVSVL